MATGRLLLFVLSLALVSAHVLKACILIRRCLLVGSLLLADEAVVFDFLFPLTSAGLPALLLPPPSLPECSLSVQLVLDEVRVAVLSLATLSIVTLEVDGAPVRYEGRGTRGGGSSRGSAVLVITVVGANFKSNLFFVESCDEVMTDEGLRGEDEERTSG